MASSEVGSEKTNEIQPEEVFIARRLADEVIDCDPAIMSLIVVDQLGRVLYVGKSARLKEEDYLEPKLVQVLGTLAILIVGAADKAASAMGRTEAVVGVFKNQKILIVNLQEYKMTLALRLSRSANAEYVCDKIGDLLATQGEK